MQPVMELPCTDVQPFPSQGHLLGVHDCFQRDAVNINELLSPDVNGSNSLMPTRRQQPKGKEKALGEENDTANCCAGTETGKGQGKQNKF